MWLVPLLPYGFPPLGADYLSVSSFTWAAWDVPALESDVQGMTPLTYDFGER